LLRLTGAQRQGLGEAARPRRQQPLPPERRPPTPAEGPPGPRERRGPMPPERRTPPPADTAPPKESPATKLYESKPGFANFYFNKLERDRLWADFRKHGDFSGLAGVWTIDG